MDSPVLRGCLTPIFIYGAFTLIICARSVSACGEGGVGSRTIKVRNLFSDIKERLLPDDYCNSVHSGQSDRYGLLNFHGAKVTVHCNSSHRQFSAKIRDCGHPETEPMEKTLTDTEIQNLGETEIEIYSLEEKETPPYGKSTSTLTYLGGQQFFEPLKQHLDAISVLLKYGQITGVYDFPIMVDTAILNAKFDSDSDIVKLSPHVSTESTVKYLAFFVGKKSVNLEYDRKSGKYRVPNIKIQAWLNNIRSAVSSAKPNYDTWTVVVNGGVYPNKFNEEVRVNLEVLRGDLYFLSKTCLINGQYGAIRFGEDTILTVERSPKKLITRKYFDENVARPPCTAVKIGSSNLDPSLDIESVHFCDPNFFGFNRTAGELVFDAKNIFISFKPGIIPATTCIVQYIEIEALEWALKKAAHELPPYYEKLPPYDDKTIPHSDYDMIEKNTIQVNIVYRQKFMLKTRVYFPEKGQIAFGIHNLAIYQKIKKAGFVELDRKTYDFGFYLQWMDQGFFTTHPSFFKEEVAGVYLEPYKKIYCKNCETAVLNEGVWHMELARMDDTWHADRFGYVYLSDFWKPL